MAKEIYLVTSNQRKVEDYNRRLNNPNYIIKNISLDLDEGRSLDIKEIAELKLKQAKDKHPNSAVMVEDRGFFIPTLNNFPGPFVKVFLNSIGIKGLLKLMAGESDRRAQFITVLAYYDGENDYYFYDIEEGFLTEEVKFGNIRGWTEILNIYGYKTYPDKALSELTDIEWDQYLIDIEKNDFIEQFKNYLLHLDTFDTITN
jgi:XTP/dITP diphosphohydrolase